MASVTRSGTPAMERWEDYFAPGERLIWEGSPVPGLHVSPGGIFICIFGLPFLCVGIFTFLAGLAGVFGLNGVAGGLGGFGGLFMVFFSLPFAGIGAAMVLGPFIAGPVAARRVRYALTDRRAYIAKNYVKRSMETYVIHPEDAVELVSGRRADTVYFHAKHGVDSDGDRTTTKVGFENIADGERVYRLIRDMQADAR